MGIGDDPVWLRVAMAILATWRITHLLANEDGPADVMLRLRRWLGTTAVGKLMDCFACLSVWVAAVMACLISNEWRDWLLAALALSGAAMLLERGSEPRLEIETLPSADAGRARGDES